jgi:hypothetical protein
LNNPFQIANLATPALYGIVRALSGRVNQTEAGRPVQADAAVNLILSFLPRDVVEMTLAGQTILFNELLADGARDALSGMTDTTRQRSRSGLVSMGRLVQGHLDRLERRGNQPYRSEAAAPREEPRTEPCERPAGAAAAQQAPSADVSPRKGSGTEARPAAAAIPVRMMAPKRTGASDGMPTGDSEVDTSWLDEPYEQWLIETLPEMAARPRAVPTGAAPARATGATRDGGTMERRLVVVPRDAQPALPRQPSGYSPARMLVDVAAGDSTPEEVRTGNTFRSTRALSDHVGTK